MYAVLLAVHNIVRWVVVVLAVLALVRAFSGWLGKREWQAMDRRAGMFYGMAFDIQFLLGLLLYLFFSDFALKAILSKGMAFVMGQSLYRFFVLEHALYMLIALVCAHLGSVLPRRMTEAPIKHRTAAIFFTLSVLFVILGMPWFRPMLPGL